MIGSHSAPGWRVTVTKSLTPNTDATPPAANTSAAKGIGAASTAFIALNIASSRVSSVNFIASGFGVEDGVAVATARAYAAPSGFWPSAKWVHRGMANTPEVNHAVDVPGDDASSHESTMVDVLEAYAQGGFRSSFVVTDDSQLECVECGTVSPPPSVSMSSLRRLEGASDPDDMVAVVAITCPACNARGTAVLGFGPMATAQDSDVLQGLRDARGDATAPGNSAHGETTGDDTPREQQDASRSAS